MQTTSKNILEITSAESRIFSTPHKKPACPAATRLEYNTYVICKQIVEILFSPPMSPLIDGKLMKLDLNQGSEFVYYSYSLRRT